MSRFNETLPIDPLWLNERKRVLHRIKKQVQCYLGPEPQDLKNYAQSYKTDIERPFQLSTMDEVCREMEGVQVVYGGDFHSFSQAQRFHLRRLRSLILKRKVVLALECFLKEHQEIVDQYGQLSEEDFLTQVQWDSHWGFPWSNYKPLLQWAKKYGMPLLALGSSHEHLEKRDQVAASQIHSSLNSYPDHVHYILFGDLHIAQSHLPQKVSELSHGHPNLSLTLYLNGEKVYFDLAQQGREDVEVVKFDKNQFCILSSPPWVKWQSYLMYLEENFDFILEDSEEEDFQEEGFQEDSFGQERGSWKKRFHVDYTDHVFSLTQMIASRLKIDIKDHDLAVYSLKDYGVLDICKEKLSPTKLHLAQNLVEQNMSFYIPESSFLYLAKPTVNQAATLAAHYIHGKLSGRREVLWDFPDHFINLIWVEAMGFFLSKWVNPKRQAQAISNFKKYLKSFEFPEHSSEPLLLALTQKMTELLSAYGTEKPGFTDYKVKEKMSYIHGAQFLGGLLGDRYFALYRRGIIDRERVCQLLSQNVFDPHFDQFYVDQIRYLDKAEYSQA